MTPQSTSQGPSTNPQLQHSTSNSSVPGNNSHHQNLLQKVVCIQHILLGSPAKHFPPLPIYSLEHNIIPIPIVPKYYFAATLPEISPNGFTTATDISSSQPTFFTFTAAPSIVSRSIITKPTDRVGSNGWWRRGW